MKKKVMLILSCLLLSVGFITAQTTRITGTVVDNNGEPVISASVVIKGTTTGVVTDTDGTFSINVPSDNTILIFSLLGMKKVEVKATPNMRVVMENDDAVLGEVVVTALGITREKKALGYATQSVSVDNLVQASNSDLAGSLQGKISGVQITPSSGMPGSSSQFVIRGARSFSGNNTPLYVVDGMPITSTSDVNTDIQNNGSVSGTDFANRAVDIDPNDIASIEILKSQAASALYGIRASNGVILINTKSGRGVAKGKPQITVNSGISFDKLSRDLKLQTKYAQGSNSLYDPTQSRSWGPLVKDLPKDEIYGGNANGHYGMYRVPQLENAGLDPWVKPATYNNVQDFYDTGVTWSNSFNLTQAMEKTSYTVSLGTTTQDGIVPSTGMDRYTARVGAETVLASQWTAGFIGNYVNTTINKVAGANDGIVATVYGAPTSYNLKGIPSYYENNPYRQNNYRGGNTFVNPYWYVDNNEFGERTSRFYGNAYTNFSTKFHSTDKKLNVKYMIGTDGYTTNYTDSWGYGNKGTASNPGQIEAYSWSNVNFNSLLSSSFDWTLNEDWTLNAVLGNEVIHESKEYKYESGANYTFSGWNNISNATSLVNEQENYSRRTVGFFGSASASYRSMLFLGVTGRQDIVSFMPRDNRSFFYPSVSASFILTELPGVKNEVLEFAKIRVAYAEVGQAADKYEKNYYSTPSYGGGFYALTPINYPINGIKGFTPYLKVYDPELKPQNTQSYELGFDVTLLGGLFDVSYTYARQNVTDQIFDVPLAGSTGIESMLTNAGKIHTNSHEFTLNINPIRTKQIDWNVGFNFSKIDNYVDELAPGVESITLGGFVTPQVRASIGEKFPTIYGSDYKRDDQGRILVDEKGLPMSGKDAVIGRVSPDFNLGMNTSLRINKVRIAAVFDWKAGGQMYHGTNNLLDLYGVSTLTGKRADGVLFDGWKEDGTKNDIRITALYAPDANPGEDKITTVQDYYSALNVIDAASVYDNSFIKLRELSVSYNIFKNSIVDITVNGFARNILIWTELPNFDPEASQGNNNMSGAFERFSLPQTSSYGFGVNLKF